MTTKTIKLDATKVSKCSKSKSRKALVLHPFPDFQKTINPYATEVFAKSDGSPAKDKVDYGMRMKVIEDGLKDAKQVEPFLVYRHEGKYVLLEDRYLEYLAVVEAKLDFDIIKRKFCNISEARIFFIQRVLIKSHLNAAQRIILALSLKDHYTKKAKANQGRRTDLLSLSQKSFESIHVTKKLAGAANVGVQSFNRMKQLVEKGEEVLGKDKADEFIEKVIQDKMSISAVYRKYRDQKEVDEKVKDFAYDYENPSLKDGFRDKILQGDNINVLKKLPDECCSLVFTSPPYNVHKVDYDVEVPVVSYGKYLKKLSKMWVESSRILRKGGRLAINIASTYTEGKDREKFYNTPILADIVQQMRDLNLPLKYRTTIIWNKRHAFKKLIKGSVASCSNPCFIANYEYIIVFSKDQWELEPEVPGAPSDLTREVYREWTTGVWDITPMSRGVKGHPAPYPETLCERVIKMFSFVGDTVVDPYLGTGTTTAVAARLGRRYFGCDISKEYCSNAAERTEKARKEFLRNCESTEEEATPEKTKKAA